MKKKFNAKINKLLQLTTHSIYSDKQLAIRELISNASDACNKLRVHMLQLNVQDSVDFNINISIDHEAKTLTISDNGIGMTYQEMESNLGTIAQSGTEDFSSENDANAKEMIGKFGIGFYSSFMIAQSVSVISKKYGESKANKWFANDYEEFEINEAEYNKNHGTSVILFINDDKFLDKSFIKSIIEKNSYNITIPIFISEINKPSESSNDVNKIDEAQIEEDSKNEQKQNAPSSEEINTKRAIWNERNVKKDTLNEFYKSMYHSNENPLFTMHTIAEGTVEYSCVLFVPPAHVAQKFMTSREEASIKLYCKGVLVQEQFKDALPSFLRFIEGVIDCPTIDLNISREIIQNSSSVNKIKQNLLKKLLKSICTDSNFNDIKKHYGQIIKEGLCDFVHQKNILEYMTFECSLSEKPMKLSEYVAGMKEDQKFIYYACGTSIETISSLPHVQSMKDEGINVILLPDNIDSIWTNLAYEYEGKPMKSATVSESNEEENKKFESLLIAFKEKLPGRFNDVKISKKLYDVASYASYSEKFNQFMQMFDKNSDDSKMYDLELNPNHEIIKKLNEMLDKKEQNKESIDQIIQTLIFTGLSRSNVSLKKDEVGLIKSIEDVLVKSIL